MKKLFYSIALLACLFGFRQIGHTQTTLRGVVLDAANKDPIIGANVVIKGAETLGTITDWDGSFELKVEQTIPLTLTITYVGYIAQDVEVADDSRIQILLQEDAIILDDVTVTGSRIADKQKESPLTIESMDIIAIKETPAADFYDGLGSLKGVDLTAASIGFKVVNTRGFNSTSPVRSLQIIDGVDNQAPGLNFSLGNFLGTSELDVKKVELVVGASSAFYGPNAFNGVISMETKDPFFQQGLSAMVKAGERNLLKTAIRWADAFQNKEGKDFIAYKLNFEYLRADDWEAENYNPVDESRVSANNPGRFDAVNIYGDEYQSRNDFSDGGLAEPQNAGLGVWYRTGYREIDLVDYDTRNLKANAAIHLRTKPDDGLLSPELIVSSSFGSGTTVYQGDNRFSLRNITFLQNKIEFRKLNKFFIRAYTTTTSAGDSYDPYFTALELQERAKDDGEWSRNYNEYWLDEINERMLENGYPLPSVEIIDGQIVVTFDADGARQWLVDNNDLLTQWHTETEEFANTAVLGTSQAVPFFVPGTERFQQEFENISGSLRTEGGTGFFDNSSLYHVHGEYIFTPTWTNKITVGANARLYTPESRGTVFSDSISNITNFEFGTYAGIEKSIFDNKVKLQGAIRADKNENYDWLFSPALSIVYTPSKDNFFRLSYSSAIRNPTLTDQFLFLNVGRAILSGNLNGVDDLVTVESVDDWRTDLQLSRLDTFSIDPVRPEQVRTFEAG
ncbi:MAG: TonB-dependent receptor, partial [Saprospiraceae bacterium]|nr:TonB-dependent receptor [Saprospiraceae bacterium]